MALAKRKSNLPAKPSELRKWILIGKVKLRAQIAAIKAITSIQEASIATQAALEDTQDLAEELLYAEAQMGAMLETDNRSSGRRTSDGTFEGRELLPNGVSKKDSHYAQQLNRNENVIAEVIAEAREKGEIPVRCHVLKIVKQKVREEAVSKSRKNIKTGTITALTGVFGVIVIDPPWPYGTKYDPDNRRAASPYPEMSMEDIELIDFHPANNAVLWLWTTHRFMRHSFGILDAWGFGDKAIVTWVKDRMGLGSWLRSQSEFCIMAVKGKPVINLTNQTTVIKGPLREHSRKPDEFYAMVESLCPGRRLDYFAREKRKGWITYGSETAKFMEQ